MIYTLNNDRSLKYSTPLVNHLREHLLYDNENLIYTKKYTNGTFSFTNPTNKYNNCFYVNGYPHFEMPLTVCLDEIEFFIKNNNMYGYNLNIRYGDTHPHKAIPKLAQVRNLLIENSLSSMVGTNVTSHYGLGDISIKTLNDFIIKNSIKMDTEDLFIKIVNNKLDIDLKEKFEAYDKDALLKISAFLKQLNLSQKNIVVESNLYKNQDLYKRFKKGELYRGELKKNGELKYTLQEMMFIYSILKKDNDVLINIIGSNQMDHVIKVNRILKNDNEKLDNRYLTYGICRNGDEREIDVWSSDLNDFIEQHKLNINGKNIDFSRLLKTLVITNSNDVILDFSNMEKHLKNIQRFNKVIESITNKKAKYEITDNNDLICKMALVGYNLNRSIEMGNQNYFYKYLFTIVNEYESNKDKYEGISGLYSDFLKAGIARLGYDIDDNKKESVKVLIK